MTWWTMGRSAPANRATQTPVTAAMSRSVNQKREYQRGLSKLRMKDRRYRASGRTQRNGIEATSRHILLVPARRRVEATAGRQIQRTRWEAVGGARSAAGPVVAGVVAAGVVGAGVFQRHQAQKPQDAA